MCGHRHVCTVYVVCVMRLCAGQGRVTQMRCVLVYDCAVTWVIGLGLARMAGPYELLLWDSYLLLATCHMPATEPT